MHSDRRDTCLSFITLMFLARKLLFGGRINGFKVAVKGCLCPWRSIDEHCLRVHTVAASRAWTATREERTDILLCALLSVTPRGTGNEEIIAAMIRTDG